MQIRIGILFSILYALDKVERLGTGVDIKTRTAYKTFNRLLEAPSP
jgi:hypothetical protein